MKAVIPAAGLGTRFLPLTKEQPKEMLPVVDRPALHWVVEEAVKSGATDLLIITGREKRAIEDYFDSHYRLTHYLQESNNAEGLRELERISKMADIHFIRQREPKGLGDAILRAERHVGKEPFLVILGDTINVAKVPVAKQLVTAHEELGSTVIAIEKVKPEKISSYGIVAGERVGERLLRIEQLVEKPRPEEAPSDWGICGTYVLTPAIFDAIKATPEDKGGEVQLTDALRELRDQEDIYGYIFDGRRYDIGTKLDWFKAHLELTLLREEFREDLTGLMRELLSRA